MSVLIVNPARRLRRHVRTLCALGFALTEVEELPPDVDLLQHQVIVIARSSIDRLPMAAARLRAKAQFGRRILIAVVPESATTAQRRALVAAGFNDAVSEDTSGRDLASAILRHLAAHVEFRCFLTPPSRKKPAA